jgi:hypothetical protein
MREEEERLDCYHCPCSARTTYHCATLLSKTPAVPLSAPSSRPRPLLLLRLLSTHPLSRTAYNPQDGSLRSDSSREALYSRSDSYNTVLCSLSSSSLSSTVLSSLHQRRRRPRSFPSTLPCLNMLFPPNLTLSYSPFCSSPRFLPLFFHLSLCSPHPLLIKLRRPDAGCPETRRSPSSEELGTVLTAPCRRRRRSLPLLPLLPSTPRWRHPRFSLKAGRPTCTSSATFYRRCWRRFSTALSSLACFSGSSWCSVRPRPSSGSLPLHVVLMHSPEQLHNISERSLKTAFSTVSSSLLSYSSPLQTRLSLASGVRGGL